jgi:hypothetical protein
MSARLRRLAAACTRSTRAAHATRDLAREARCAVRARPRHASRSASALPALAASLAIALPLTGVIFALNSRPSQGTTQPAALTPGALGIHEFSRPSNLPAATTQPLPDPTAVSSAPNLRSHEVFGFAPYWTLLDSDGFDVQGLTTLAYFSLDVSGDGSVDESGPGWNGYESQALVDLIDRAHASGDRVVLTLTCFDQPALDRLASEPASAARRLDAELVGLLSAKQLDGVNIDFEGQGAADRQGLDSFVSELTASLREADPHWQITMDTYASSAGDPSGFYDVGGLAPYVDGFFVMAYDMEDPAVPSPTAPLGGPGSSDTSALEQYEAVVPASKLILGIPAYGYDWPTSGPSLGSAATAAPTPVTYAQVSQLQGPVYWDASSQTPWAAYQSDGSWHQVFFDDPLSIALKARTAAQLHAAGVGLWALGMDGNDPAVAAALTGSARSVRYAASPVQPSAQAAPGQIQGSSTSPSPGAGSVGSPGGPHTYSGTWNGHSESLERVEASSLPGGGRATSAGTLTSFRTDDPAFECLSGGPPLSVSELSSSPTTYVVSATQPADCASGNWTFSAPASQASSTTPSSSTTTPGPLSGLVPGSLGATGTAATQKL